MTHSCPTRRSSDRLDSLAAVGETFHGDPNGGLSWLHPYADLSVRWTADGSLKGVEIEEFMPPPGPSDEWVFARYLHAIRDTTKQVFVHRSEEHTSELQSLMRISYAVLCLQT